jgi:putative nucleotidyltransferase with HDIG domain
MVLDPKAHALRCLLAAYETRDVYGVDHACYGAGVSRCIDMLKTLHEKASSVTIALVSGGVLIDGAMITDRWAAAAPLIARLQARGVEGIRLSAGISAEDLQWLFDTAQNVTATVSPSRRVVVGKVSGPAGESHSVHSSAVAAPLPPLAATPDDSADVAMVGSLRESWSALLTRSGGQQDGRIATLASRIIAATVSNRQSIVPLIELKSYDEYTFVHVTNVAILSSALAEAIGIAGTPLQHVTEAALLHDVGKWTIPKRILSKAGNLTDEERAVVRQHPVIGAAVLAGTRGVSDLAIITAYEHHLRLDGKGYPETGSIRRPSTPSQIVQIADIFDALRSNRPYRAGMPLEQCLSVMDKEAGCAFDRGLYQVFCDRVVGRVAGRVGPAAGMSAAAA